MYDPNLRVPFGYWTATRTLAEVEAWLAVHHHPEYVRRFLHWLNACGGNIGPGGGWRATQPVKDGFAPPGKSFHETQPPEPYTYSDGFRGACAVDVVARNPGHIHRTVRWDEVPAQDSKAAALYGVHANVNQGATPEPWHIQPVEIDGWASWMAAGRPAPAAGYPLPGDTPTPPPPAPPPIGKVTTMIFAKRVGGTTAAGWTGVVSFDNRATWQAVSGTQWANLLASGHVLDNVTFKRVTTSSDVTWTAT